MAGDAKDTRKTALIISISLIVIISLVCLFAYKAIAIVISSILLFLIIGSFSYFAYDMLIRVGNRSTAPVIFFILVHVFGAIVLFGEVLRWTGLRYVVDPAEHKHSFWGAIYFSIVTWTTVGYGDIVPGKNARAIATAEAVIGYIAMAVFIAVLSAIFQSRTRRHH